MPLADVGFERLRSAINVVVAPACADLPAPVEDDPGFIVLSEPESWRLGFAARHDGFTNLRIARGVVRSLPTTLAISRVPAVAALRNDDNVNGPCGKKTAAASTRVITSSSPHLGGIGSCFRAGELVGVTLWHVDAVLMNSRDLWLGRSARGVCEICSSGNLMPWMVRQSAASECKSDALLRSRWRTTKPYSLKIELRSYPSRVGRTVIVRTFCLIT